MNENILMGTKWLNTMCEIQREITKKKEKCIFFPRVGIESTIRLHSNTVRTH